MRYSEVAEEMFGSIYAAAGVLAGLLCGTEAEEGPEREALLDRSLR